MNENKPIYILFYTLLQHQHHFYLITILNTNFYVYYLYYLFMHYPTILNQNVRRLIYIYYNNRIQSTEICQHRQLNIEARQNCFTVPFTFLQCPSLRGRCSHQGGHKDVQCYRLCVKNWSVDNTVRFGWITLIIVIRNLMLKYVKIVKVAKNCNS